MEQAKPTACFNCCHIGGGYYTEYEGETEWYMGLTSDGQAHYACADCAPSLFNARKLHIASADALGQAE